MMRISIVPALAGGVLLALPLQAQEQAQDPFESFAELQARSIGPAGMSGRVTAICGLESDPVTLYVGTATGGLWLTHDDGLTWERIFDDQPVASIGDVQVRQDRPEEIWVGTGEGNPRNSSSVGNGVYRSLDGGKTWTHCGLEGTEKIARLILHPTDPNTAWAAALGTTWGENPERGVYKTTDGGRTWRQVLFVDERSGCADLVIDPKNPDKLVAAMWDHRRQPSFFRSGGPGSGLYLSRDGGESWQEVTQEQGMPEGDLGRIGLAFSRSDPRTLYALVETSKKNTLLRSDDGGASFHVVNQGDVGGRPFYYADIRVDPADPDRVYSLESVVFVSDDGGKSWRTLIPYAGVHPDHHAMWINPRDPRHIVEGNDGGLAISRNRGESWRFVRNLPLAQLYHIAVDNELPYNVYGGMQDNGSWRGPSSVWENGGIRNHHWTEVGFGDGFATLPMPDDASRGYAMSQGGALMRWDLRTGERKGIRPDGPEGVKLRFNWNAGIATDPHDPAAVYYGSQFLHLSRDRGESWSIISPDLTTDNADWQRQAESGGLTPDVTAAENYCSILTIAPSPLDAKTIWVGTDDGRLHVTRDGGENWESLEERLFDVPRNTWIPCVIASHHSADRAYVVLDDHRRANWTPYVFKTEDGGAHWTNLGTDDIWGYAHVIEEDPVDPNLLYLGTEFGLYISRDGGASWAQWTHGIPTCPVTGLVVHPREHDLVVGTFGRAIYIIDDIRPLRAVPEELLDAKLRLCEIPPAYEYRVAQTGESRFPGDEEFRGSNRPRGARLSLMVADGVEEGEAKISFLDGEGQIVRRLTHKVHPGLNRIGWNLRETGFRGKQDRDKDEYDLPGGPEVLPGDYTVRVELGEETTEAELHVLADPRVEVPLEARRARNQAIRRAGKLGERLARIEREAERIQKDLGMVRKLIEREDGSSPEEEEGAAEADDEASESPHKALLDAAKAFEAELDTFLEGLHGPKESKGITENDSVASKVRGLPWGLGSSWDAPTPAELRRIAEAEKALADATSEWKDLVEGESWRALQAAWREAGLELLADPEPVE